jgi:P27 family predicted phage terminase small subunit
MPRGRPRKPTADLILEDKFRRDRHGEPSEVWIPAGAPQMPDWLGPDAQALWRSVVPALANRGVATSVDAAELGALCDWFARYRTAIRALDAVTDIKSTEYYRLQILAGAAFKNFSTTASKFGLNPSDRARLCLSEPRKDNGLSGFARIRNEDRRHNETLYSE